jgi:hypothetical protein
MNEFMEYVVGALIGLVFVFVIYTNINLDTF